MFKRIPNEIKEEILNRIKQEGIKVPQIASQYRISDKTIYGWLKNGVNNSKQNLVLEVSKLKRENDDLLKIIGKLTAESERKKKNIH